MHKKQLVMTFAILISSLLVFVSSCDTNPAAKDYADGLPSQRETVTQVSTIDALLNGIYDGVMDFGTLKQYGDFGIGTFDSLDGEMLGFDGNFYQVKADGIAYGVTDSMETPFAAVTYFDTDSEHSLPEGIDYETLQDYLDGLLPTENIFYAMKIEGTFSYMKTRSVPGQEKPYPPLSEVTENQPVFEFHDAEGTIVGFRCPAYVAGVNVPGYHLHFLTGAKDAGGHILDFTVKNAAAYIDYTSEFLMILPGDDSDFYDTDLTGDKQEELEKVEK
ncbi:MAG: acetolactate decarboxylase [Dehalococcoidales bacterium]|nr:acetolactate decarboxylase [Dehalococcoidales bacterium]